MATTYTSDTISVTTADSTTRVPHYSRAITLYNAGSADVQVEFDAAVDSDSFLIASGKSLSLPALEAVNLHLKTASGSATVYLLAISN